MAEFENIFDEDSHLENDVGQSAQITLGTVTYAAGISLMTALTVVIGMLLYSYLQSRPWDLTEHTEALAKLFVEHMAANYIPPENVRVLSVAERVNETGRWNYYDFEVIVPPHVDFLGVQELTRESLAEQNIAMNPISSTGGGRKYSLSIERYLFGNVMFHQQAGATSVTDEESVCRDARERVRDAILREGVSSGALSVESVRPVEGQAMQAVRFTAFLSDDLTPERLNQAITEAVKDADMWTDMQTLSEQRELIRTYYRNILCVELLCIRAAPVLPAAVEPPVQEADSLPLLESESYDEDAALTEPGDDGEGEEVRETQSQDAQTVEAEEITGITAPAGRGRVAIILDDGGYGGNETARILELDKRLTLAILPDTPFARQTARDAADLGFEIMLHMPMQTGTNGRNSFPGELELTMRREEIQERTRDCIAQFPEAVGVNNHTGAAFTADEEKMRWFLEVVKDHDLYFVDSRTTARSRAHDVSVELGIPSASRDIFLDNSSDLDEIRAQLDELIRRARASGAAIGIGHFRRNTVSVLAEDLPGLKARGVDLVHASELVR